LQLVFERGPLAGQSVSLEGGTLVAGRGEGSDLRLPETGVSRQHARFQASAQGWTVVDLGSTNGTFVNEQRLPANQPYLLRPGDRVAIGSSILVVQPGEPEGRARPEAELAEGAVRSRPHPALLAAGAIALVVVLVGIVILLVTLLQPEPGPATPTVEGPLEQISTVLPIPGGMEGVMTSVVTMMPSSLPFFPLGPTATPSPEGAVDGQPVARGPAKAPSPIPLPEPPVLSGREAMP
jgi:hypothetical protein